ncbi:hypothetical protein [Pedobacter panaciterrae]
MKKLLAFTFVPLLLILSQAKALKRTAIEITIAKDATHVALIKADTVVVITGSTYLFTVDTPEDKGLISTSTTVNQLTREIKSKDGSLQTYRITTKDGSSKTEGALITGDKLVVTSGDKQTEKSISSNCSLWPLEETCN